MKTDRTPHILIVDDSRTDRQRLRKILSHEGYEVIEATDGADALSVLAAGVPDLILLDVVMPGMNGFEVCNEIKGSLGMADVPVLFVTSMASPEDKMKGFEAGGADYIIKPFHSQEVLARIKTHIQLKAAIKTVREHNEKLEQMLEERTKELIRSERQAAIGQLVQGIVHNMNNPLTSISGSIELLCIDMERLKGIALNNSVSVFSENETIFSGISLRMDTIRRLTNQLINMINSLMSKSLSDRIEKFEIIDLNDIINQELSFLNADLRLKHQVKKRICLSDYPLSVCVVPSMISQVFQNFIRNALDATCNTPGPTLTVMTGMTRDEIWFSVSDNGPGIPEEIREYIFDPFFTTKSKDYSSNNKNPCGTGLGLYISREMITSNHGSIEIESNADSGTTFQVRLPKYANKYKGLVS